jgi:xanthine dehydrogenase large subunit
VTQQPDRQREAIAGGMGAAWPHDSAAKHVAGTAIYIDDIPEPPGTLHLYIAMSPRAHARIRQLDVARVRAAQGVAAVLTAADIPGINDISPTPSRDDPLFAADLVQYHGQAIFAVAAETIGEARAAAGLAGIELDDLPALTTIEAAAAAGSHLQPPVTMAMGDAPAAIAAAPLTVEGVIAIGGQEHFYLEGQAALAVPGEDDEITLHSSTQHPSEIQHKVADVLGVASHAVTVIVRRMGGGFGGKESQGNLPAAAAALAAWLTRRPVKCVYDRDDDFMLTGKRHDFRIRYRAGFDAEGRILAIDVGHQVRCGMSFDLSEPVADRAMLHADNCYHLPAARIASERLKTHTQSNTAFRGFGGPQGIIGAERIVDHIAFALGKDPLDVRSLNFYPDRGASGDEARRLTHYGMAVEDCVIGDLVATLARSSDYAARRRAIGEWNRGSPVIKRGIALAPVKFGISFTKTFMNQAGALLHVYSDGSIGLNHGGTEMGQGLHVKVAQVVADELQVDIGRIRITATSTGKVPNTSPTAASSGTDLNGMAARDAARQIKARLVAFLAERHQAKPAEIAFLPSRVRIRGEEIAFEAVVKAAYMARVHLSAAGFYATPKISWDRAAGRGRPFFYFAYGAAVSEVAIDTLTGESRLLRADILHDAGRSLNPAIDLGQIEGGFVQGAGWLTTEELVWDAAGRLLTHAPSTYKIPACSDRPLDLRMALYERGEAVEETVNRAKAVGEPPLVLAVSVLMALSDAVASVGGHAVYPSLDAPATPERILAAVDRVRSAAGGGRAAP